MKYGNTSKIFKVLHNSCSVWSRFLWCPSTWLHRNSPTRAQNTQKCSWLSWHVATHLGTIPLVPSNLIPSLYNWDILGYRAQALLQDLSLHQILLGSSLRSLVKTQILQGMVPPWEVLCTVVFSAKNHGWRLPQEAWAKPVAFWGHSNQSRDSAGARAPGPAAYNIMLNLVCGRPWALAPWMMSPVLFWSTSEISEETLTL